MVGAHQRILEWKWRYGRKDRRSWKNTGDSHKKFNLGGSHVFPNRD